jgi:hypothetical protein
MKAPRWLLPFTNALDMRALDAVLSLAQSHGATLLAVSLVVVPHKSRTRGARLERIQQSKDFLEALRYKAARQGVPLERYEIFTGDVVRSLALLAHDQRCDSIVLVSREGKECLLHDYELKRLLEVPPASLVLVRLPAQAGRAWIRLVGNCLISWLRPLRAGPVAVD